MNTNENIDPRDKIKLKNPENFYQIIDKNGQIIDYDRANGKQLFNHYRHNMTNYDEVLDEIREKQGYVKGYQQKNAVKGAAEEVLEKYHEEHLKVVQDSLEKRDVLKEILSKAKVKTTSALVKLLDDCSEKVKKIRSLERSQRSLRTWNDTYRVQKKLVEKLIIEEDLEPEIAAKIKSIYSADSVNKAIEEGCDIFDLERSEILKIVKQAIRYSKLVQEG